jgi:predicted amidophosphoribosyltransferase
MENTENNNLQKTWIVINCDGYYPECGFCGYWLSLKDMICPKCGKEVDWDDKR